MSILYVSIFRRNVGFKGNRKFGFRCGNFSGKFLNEASELLLELKLVLGKKEERSENCFGKREERVRAASWNMLQYSYQISYTRLVQSVFTDKT